MGKEIKDGNRCDTIRIYKLKGSEVQIKYYEIIDKKIKYVIYKNMWIWSNNYEIVLKQLRLSYNTCFNKTSKRITWNMSKTYKNRK